MCHDISVCLTRHLIAVVLQDIFAVERRKFDYYLFEDQI